MLSTKIICTIGPASESTDILMDLAREGMNVARLNFSHGTHSSHQQIIEKIRELNKQRQFPKIQISTIIKTLKNYSTFLR